MADEVFMDIPQVEKMSKDFNTFGEVLDAVSKALEAISTLLKATAWLSLGATAAVATFIDRIRPNVKKAADKMKELSQDINSAIRAYRDGDLSGSRRFV
jgi:type II secretory pathway component PulF